ncbi:MAG TPA: glycosyltransferase [Gemmatimonadaceae bacterium]|nr:glycosyltransferase [Gemmatimonadaceae bacterium]
MSGWLFLAVIPWLILPPLALWRARSSRSLDEESGIVPDDAAMISVIIPARNEAHNIERCLRSVLASTYPALEVVLVDDHSEDGTADRARLAAGTDDRLRILEAPALPNGWFGKQWACSRGALAARGDLLCFTDADTVHAPDLLVRAHNALRARDADLLSVFGRQEVGSFWERVVQPQVFFMLSVRYGGTERVNQSRRVSDKIANGQFLLVRRSAYDSSGGHGAVRAKVAEDLALAQRFFAEGRTAALVLGARQLTTRMYTSLGEVVRGWMKNIFAGSLDAVPLGRAGRALLPLLLLSGPVFTLAPVLVLGSRLVAPLPAALFQWSVIASLATLAWWGVIYTLFARTILAPPSFASVATAYALAFPLGAAVLLYITARALIRGRRVEWKGRAYRAG